MSNTRQSYNSIDVNNTSTGVVSFGGLSINSDNSKFNVGEVRGWWVNNTIPQTPISTYKSYPLTASHSLTYLSTHNVTYVAMNVNGEIIQKTSPFEPEEQRDVIPLGVIVHSNRTSINAINNQPVVSLTPNNQLSDLIESIGFFNISGNVFTTNDGNLSINKTAGHIFKQGSNFINNYKDPHTLYLSELIAPSNIRYRLQNGTEYSNTNVIDPNHWDDGGVLTLMTGSRWSIQRIFIFQSNLVRIQYGQATYTSLANALQSIQSETFVKEQNIAENGLFRALLIVKKNTTNLSDSDNALFLEIPKFDSVAGLGGLSTTSLQQAYINSTSPEIITNDELGAISLKKGETNPILLETKNSSNVTTLTINENGDVDAHSLVLTSPDLTKWRVTISDLGILTTTQI